MAVINSIKDSAEKVKSKASALWSSSHELNKLAIDKMEETTKLGLASTVYFSAAGFRQLRAVSKVKDMESMRDFTADSITLSGEIAKKLLDDGKSLLGIGVGMKDKIASLFANAEEVAQKKPAAKSTAA